MKLPKSVATETDVAEFLLHTPSFFERQAPLLATVRLFSGYGSRAVCLQERQASLLRSQIRVLENRVADMLGHAQANATIASKLHAWTRQLLQIAEHCDIPQAIVQGLTVGFEIPQVALKIWGVSGDFSNKIFVNNVSAQAQAFAESLTLPYCGKNSDFEAVNWLPEPALAVSVALIPLRAKADVKAPVLGLLVLAAPDTARFHSDMGTEFLERLGELAGAALSRLPKALAL